MSRADLGLVVFLSETERRVVFILLFLLLGVTAAETVSTITTKSRTQEKRILKPQFLVKRSNKRIATYSHWAHARLIYSL